MERRFTNPNCDRAVFFILFRECIETTVVISVLLAFLKQTLGGEEDKKTYKKLVKQASHFCYITPVYVNPEECTC